MTAIRNLIEKRCYLNLGIVACLVILPFIAIIYYVMPSTDEYVMGAFSRDYGFIVANKLLFNVMNARFLSNALILSCGVFTRDIFGLVTCNRAYTVLAFVFLYLSIFYSAMLVSRDLVKTRQLWIPSLLGLILYLLNMPSVSHGFYWTPAAVNYQLGHGFFLLLFSSLFRYWFIEPCSARYYHGVVIFASTVMLFGCNETIAMTAWGVIFALSLFSYINKLPQYRFVIYLFLFGLLCASIAIFAPGTYRYIVDHDMQAPLHVRFAVLVISFAFWLPRWILNFNVIFATLLLLPFYYRLLDKYPCGRSWRFFIVAILLWIATMLLALAPQHILLSNPYMRVWNVAYFLFLVGWFVNVYIFLGVLQAKGREYSFSELTKGIIHLVFVLSLIFNHTFMQAINDLLNAAPAYRHEMQWRYYQIFKQARNNETRRVTVSKLDNQPVTIFFADGGAHQDHLINKYYASYFKLNSINFVNKETLPVWDIGL